MPPIADLISWVMICAGSFFLVVGAIGLVRMPDVFTRMHAVSVAETLGVGLLLGGLMIQAGLTLVTFKLALLFFLIFFTSPVASHSIARAAMADGVKPILSGPEIDARTGRLLPAGEKDPKIVTPIDAGEAESSASVLVSGGYRDEDDKEGPKNV
ncbi:MAG: monovalent cation/H(+) antiporter subunit G [Pseudomonadota bacterium]